MTNHTNEVVETKKRRAPLKVQKTGKDIVEEINQLTSEAAELATALDEIAPNSAGHAIIKKAFDEKDAELAAALSKVHHS
jgi:anti-sigma regulatory factor (Ser/Thr protein kinase)